MTSKINKKIKILVAMSGGVDSSVAAALLVEEGYEVTGMFAVNYQASPSGLRPTSSDKEFTGRSEAESCWRPDYQDALRVAAKLGIPLLRWDFTKEYKKMVLDYMYNEYSVGRTPNPDILCNKFVKFGAWLDKARKMEFEKIGTGHYAKIMEHESWSMNQKDKKNVPCSMLCVPCDKNKDQTYFLHQLSQKQLQHVLFPLGDYTKPEVRKLAKKFKLPTAEKEESMGICFVGEVNMKDFLKNKITTKIGDIVLSNGEKVGEHEGLGFYTIGQRIGLKLPITNYQLPINSQNSNSKSLFIIDKDVVNSRLIIGYENDPLLHKKEIVVEDINWISGHPPKFPLKCEVRLRHRQPLQKCVVVETHNCASVQVKFDQPQRAITPGQFAVFYLPRQSSKGAKAGGNVECLGGGVIK